MPSCVYRKIVGLSPHILNMLDYITAPTILERFESTKDVSLIELDQKI